MSASKQRKHIGTQARIALRNWKNIRHAIQATPELFGNNLTPSRSHNGLLTVYDMDVRTQRRTPRATRRFGKGTGIALRKKDDDPGVMLNKALSEILADGTNKKINDKHFSFSIY